MMIGYYQVDAQGRTKQRFLYRGIDRTHVGDREARPGGGSGEQVIVRREATLDQDCPQ